MAGLWGKSKSNSLGIAKAIKVHRAFLRSRQLAKRVHMSYPQTRGTQDILKGKPTRGVFSRFHKRGD